MFFDQPRHDPASGPLYRLYPLSGMLFLQIYVWLTPLHLLQTFAQMPLLWLGSMRSRIYDDVWHARCLLGSTSAIKVCGREDKEAEMGRGRSLAMKQA